VTYVAMLLCFSVQNFTEIGLSSYGQNVFHYSGRPPSWICCDIIILHNWKQFYGSNVVLNFYVDWFCSFPDTCDIIRRHLGCIGLLLLLLVCVS